MPVHTSGGTNPFSLALVYLKGGSRVARIGWHGKGMWLQMHVPDPLEAPTAPYIDLNYPVLHEAYPSGRVNVPWKPDQMDILADDWVLVED